LFKLLIRNHRWQIFFVSLLVMIFIFSYLMYLYQGRQYREVLAYFPNSAGTIDIPDIQFIPFRHDTAESIRLFASEILLGPVDILRRPFLHSRTRVHSVFYLESDRRLVLSLNEFAQFPIETGRGTVGQVVEIQKGFEVLEHNIRSNFPHIRQIDFLIMGQVPNFFHGSVD
jgi:hypothetical protein